MTLTGYVDTLIDPVPNASFTVRPSRSMFFALLALLSWTMAELLMAPALRPLWVGFWGLYAIAFFIVTGWYYRLSRLFETPWHHYVDGIAPLVWTTAPLVLALPAALIAMHGGAGGKVAFELVKLGIILAVLTRVVAVLQRLNQWPRWACAALVLSPLALVLAVFMAALLAAVAGVSLILLGALAH